SVIHRNGGFKNTGTCFGMEAFERNVETSKLVNQIQHKLRALRCAQDAVTAHSWTQRDQFVKILFPNRLGGFAKNPKLVFRREPGAEASSAGPRDYFLQNLPG